MDLYYHPISPPCWSVLLLGRELDLSFNLQQISFAPDCPLRETFVKLNPQHQVPTLADGEFGLGESRAILRYLLTAHSGSDDHPLYPKDPKARAVIESRLDFDLGMLYRRAYDYFSPQWNSKSVATEKDLEKVCEALGFLEEFLGRSRYAAGDRLTVADLTLVASVSFLDVCGFGLEKYPKIVAWYDVCKKEIKGYQELVGDRFEDFRKAVLKMKQ
ncbi:hypothetical protein quinque_012629 [Culex quinquefasciatus]